eukprot:1095129-Rhodomonas_salina.1
MSSSAQKRLGGGAGLGTGICLRVHCAMRGADSALGQCPSTTTRPTCDHLPTRSSPPPRFALAVRALLPSSPSSPSPHPSLLCLFLFFFLLLRLEAGVWCGAG